MASLYIKDDETAALIARLAKRAGMTKTALVKELGTAREAELDRIAPRASAREELDALWSEHAFPASAGTKVDKAFFDEMWGEDGN